MRNLAIREQKARIGQLFFSSMSHSLYDVGLYRYVTEKFWHCPTECLLDNYADNISNNHLEVGVGSGYFLERTLCADFLQRLMLLDLNKRCLNKSARRLSAYTPTLSHQSVRRTISYKQTKFASIGMNYVLHCIPGSFSDNRKIFENVHEALVDGGVFFGATLLPGGTKRAPQRLSSKLFMKVLNWFGIFYNTNHTMSDLERVLAGVFSKVQVTRIGDAAVFVAVK